MGSLGTLLFREGCYAYVGSALGGLRNRVGRHLRRDKRFHWHIDHLLAAAPITYVAVREGTTREECTVAACLAQHGTVVRGFGSSDCRCPGHLFRIREDVALEMLSSSGFSLLNHEEHL
ncbi:MAG: GIY-YIG nuclease family protein [Candidatus Methanofastidiosa archaeon]|nr:GIY-YIG nuclease family protein [Candidatus Methanofastidiosa archaeon]